MQRFNYTPDDMIRIENDDFLYIDRLQYFAYDCGTLGLRPLFFKPGNIRDYQAGIDPTISYAITKTGSQVDFETMGQKPDYCYDYINDIQELLVAQANRPK